MNVANGAVRVGIGTQTCDMTSTLGAEKPTEGERVVAGELEHLGRAVARGLISRRAFLGRAAALGVALPVAQALLDGAVAANPVTGGTIKIGANGGASTDTLDPGSYTSTVMGSVGYWWGETLVQTDPMTGAAVPVLAESWEASSDAKTWAFAIRKGVTFSNGKELTPDDVVATLQRHSDEASKSGALGVMQGIGRDFKADGDKVVFTLANPNADLPFLLSDYHLLIQPGGGMDNPNAGIGTGPYVLEINEPGIRHVGTKRAGHWRADVGFVDTLELLVLNDASARTAALTSGQVHIINRVDPKTVALLKRAPNLAVHNSSGRGHYVFIAHCDTAPFDNNDLRLALKFAMDRQQMVDTVLQGFGTIGNDFPINAAYALYPDTIPQRPYDPDQAAFHYKKSGHSGSILLRTSNAAFNGAEDAAVLYQQTCAKAGITIEVKREPADGYWSNVWNVQPFSTSYWGGRPTQDQMYTTAYLSTADWNDTRWKRPEFDAMLFQARGELDPAKRKQIYTDMALMMHNEGGLILPMFNDFIDAASTKVQGQLTDRGFELSNLQIGLRAWLAA